MPALMSRVASWVLSPISAKKIVRNVELKIPQVPRLQALYCSGFWGVSGDSMADLVTVADFERIPLFFEAGSIKVDWADRTGGTKGREESFTSNLK